MSFGLFAHDASVSGPGSLMNWIQFFGIELAKGVPIVDWADIYGVSPEAPFGHFDDNAMSRHLVFGARLMVDIVIIAALLQAWGIVRRNADQMTLFKDGQLDLFDPCVERARFKKGVTLGADGSASFDDELEALFKEHAHKAKGRHNGRLVPYDERRLSALLLSKDKTLKAVAEKLSEDYSLLVGSVHNQLQILSNRMMENVDLIGGEAHIGWTIEQRNAFEGVVRRANEDHSYLSQNYILVLRKMIELTASQSYFYDANLTAYELLGRQKTRYGVYALASALLPKDQYRVLGWQAGSPIMDKWAFEQERYQEVRQVVVMAIENICSTPVGQIEREAVDEVKKMGLKLSLIHI